MMRIAVLGCGSIGRRHLGNLHALGQTDLLAYDPDPIVRQSIESELGIPCQATLESVWERSPEIVLVTAPSRVHIELALAAVRHDCHLFIEKPLSYSPDGIELLQAEVQGRKLVSMVACNMRFHPGPVAVKQFIHEGVIGNVIAARIQSGSYLPRWRPMQDCRNSYSASPEWGGAILDCIHEIDLALWYFGSAKVEAAVHLPADSIGLQTNGLAEILLHHESKVLCNVHVNFVQRDYRRTCQVIGSEGTIYWDFGDRRVTMYGPDGEIKQILLEPDAWKVNQMYVDEMSYFLQCVQARTETMNPLAGGLAALQIALAAKQTLKQVDP